MTHNDTRAYIFGFGDARDRSWLTPAIEQAFEASQEIWFETSQVASSEESSSTASEEFSRYDAEHNLFDMIGPKLSARLAAAADMYGVPHEALVHTRVWWSYFVLNSGYWAWRAQNRLGDVSESPDRVLSQQARVSNKTVHAEFATPQDATRWFATLSERAARERLEKLLDYLDDEKKGLHSDRFDWISGHPSDRAIEMMRHRQPALYEAEHIRRNEWWAARIAQLLANGGVYFIAIGLNHTLGPQSLLEKLRALGLEPESI